MIEVATSAEIGTARAPARENALPLAGAPQAEHLDDRIGQDPPGPIGLSARMLAHLESLAKHHPHKIAGFINGLAYSDRGLAARLKSGLASYMTLPPAEADRLVRARMAELIVIRCAANNCITHEDLLAGGFTEAEITKHFHAAKRIARVARMAA